MPNINTPTLPRMHQLNMHQLSAILAQRTQTHNYTEHDSVLHRNEGCVSNKIQAYVYSLLSSDICSLRVSIGRLMSQCTKFQGLMPIENLCLVNFCSDRAFVRMSATCSSVEM